MASSCKYSPQPAARVSPLRRLNHQAPSYIMTFSSPAASRRRYEARWASSNGNRRHQIHPGARPYAAVPASCEFHSSIAPEKLGTILPLSNSRRNRRISCIRIKVKPRYGGGIHRRHKGREQPDKLKRYHIAIRMALWKPIKHCARACAVLYLAQHRAFSSRPKSIGRPAGSGDNEAEFNTVNKHLRITGAIAHRQWQQHQNHHEERRKS